MRIIKRSWKYPAVFLITAVLLTALLTAAAFIPKSAIRKNVQKSAEFLCEGELFGAVVSGVEGSKIDRYADAVLLAICYQYDEKEPLTSVMWSSYYHTKYQNENENLLAAVTKDLAANQQYLRYWHGSNAILRPLLLVFSLEQIYVINAVILAALTIGLFLLLVKRKAWIPAIGLLMGLVLTASWFVPLSLEYTWTYLLMLLMSILSLKLAFLKKWERLGPCFLVVGMLTNYMDFLTTETLTLLVPLLLVVWVRHNQGNDMAFSETAKNAGKWILSWGFGYFGMWLMKWGMASVVLRQNVLPYVLTHISERVSGDVGVNHWQYITGTLWRNVKCLFPLEYGEIGALLGGSLLLAVCYAAYVYHKKQIRKENILLYAGIGILPFVRYLVLLNHSYLHYFFTYRALLAAILVIAMILGEVVEWRWMIRADDGKRNA